MSDPFEPDANLAGPVPITVDLDGDGIPELAVGDTDGDSEADWVAQVDDAGGTTVLADTDGLGGFDTTAVDADGDGHFETVARDLDGDLNPDVVQSDRDGDSFYEETTLPDGTVMRQDPATGTILEIAPSGATTTPVQTPLTPDAPNAPTDQADPYTAPDAAMPAPTDTPAPAQAPESSDDLTVTMPEGDVISAPGIDTNSDGLPDTIPTDQNQDGRTDGWMVDTDGDQRIDTLLVDQDGDGRPDITMHDVTESGGWAVDTPAAPQPSSTDQASPSELTAPEPTGDPSRDLVASDEYLAYQTAEGMWDLIVGPDVPLPRDADGSLASVPDILIETMRHTSDQRVLDKIEVMLAQYQSGISTWVQPSE